MKPMPAGYQHYDVFTSQSPKPSRPVCGDALAVDRTETATTIFCADGIGSGIKAHIAAHLCISRLQQLIRDGMSFRDSFARMVATINRWREPSLPYAAFAMLRILRDGQCTFLSYDFPTPIYLTPPGVSQLLQKSRYVENALINESFCRLEIGESILLFSDGIVQAGLGAGLAEGWGGQGICDFCRRLLRDGIQTGDIARRVHRQAQTLWKTGGDDCTACLLYCRPGVQVNILTGPPASPHQDALAARNFLQKPGIKIVCGASTAKIVARFLNQKLKMEENPVSMITPPRYELPGVDLVTEGAVTLNQLYNIIDEPSVRYEEKNAVTELLDILKSADRINWTVGVAANPANESICFRQQGIIPRLKILPLIAEKLKQMGKLVVTYYI